MNQTILFVDDEENILAGFRRHLRGKYTIKTATNGQQGLEMLRTEGPFAVTVADLRMPVMDGIEYFSHAKDLAPDTVRIMLTGHADLSMAINAVNEGRILRFLTKPCPAETLLDTLAFGVEQYRLVTAERDLMEKTLKSSVALLTEILGISNPQAFSQSLRLRRIVRQIAIQMGSRDTWLYELAAMLSQIGWIALPDYLMDKATSGEVLSVQEKNMLASHPLIGSRLLENIPRLEEAASIIKDQQRPYSSYTNGGLKRINLGAQTLKAALGYDRYVQAGFSHMETVNLLVSKNGEYNPLTIEALGVDPILKDNWFARKIDSEGLEEGMVVDEDIYSQTGELLIAKNQEITAAIIERLQVSSKTGLLIEPFRVLVSQPGSF